MVGARHADDTQRAGEALLICFCVASVVATLCIGFFYWIEGLHYASIFDSARDFAKFWLRYLAGFAIPGLVGWALARVLVRPGSRRVSEIAVLVGCCVPVVVGLAATRPMLLVPGVIAGGVAVALLGIGSLLYAMRRQHRTAIASLVFLLAGAPAGLTAFNLVTWLRPSEFDDAGRLALAAAVCLGAALLPTPILLAMRAPRSEQRIRHLLGAFLVVTGILVVTIAIPRARLAPTARSLARHDPARTSVLLIVVDTLRADAVSGFGRDVDATPAIHALAQDSVVFTRVMSAASWTTPSFASVLSSTYPSGHRAGSRDVDLGYKRSLVDRLPTMPATLRDHGFWTGSVLTNAYLGRRFGLDRGFDAYENLLAAEWAHPVLIGMIGLGWGELAPFVRAPQQTERLLGLIRRGSESGRPFFVLAHYMDPHPPYRGKAEEGPLHGTSARLYRREVGVVDESIGTLIRELKRAALYDDMLIVLTADHGEELEEGRGYGEFGHGHTMFEEVLHVPLLVKLPRNVGAGKRRDDLASSIDVAPTILDVVDVQAPATFLGRSLFARASGERAIFSERTLYGPERKAVILGSRKVVLDFDDAGRAQLHGFDLAVDPGEKRPIDPTDPSFRSLADSLVAFAAGDVEREGEVVAEVDPRFRQRLEALGYVE